MLCLDRTAPQGARPLLMLLAMAAGLAGLASCNKMLMATPAPGTTSTTGALTRESHGAYFPIGSGSFHATETCDDCHGGFSDFTQYTCKSCHAHATDVAAQRHVFITGFVNESTGCYTCHPNGRETAISVVDHSAKYFPIDAASAHGTLQCSDCHTWVTTSRPFTCMGCHTHDQDVTAAKHTAITGYRYDANGCFGCHPSGGETPIAASDHSAQFFPIQTGSHAAMACASCHTDPTTSKTFVCTTCHTQAATAAQHPTAPNYSFTDAGCYSCHPQDR